MFIDPSIPDWNSNDLVRFYFLFVIDTIISHFRRVSAGPIIGALVILVVLTYLLIRIKAPTLPENHQEQGFMKGSLVIAVAWIVALIALGSGLGRNGRHSKMEDLLIGQSVATIVTNFLLPLYFIYRTPNLHQYVKSFFVKPSFMNNEVQPVQPPEPTVHFHNATNVIDIGHI